MKTKGKKKQASSQGLVPQLRFPEFLEAGDWEERPLESICGMQAGKFVSASKINEKFEAGLYPCYGGNGLRGFTKTHTHTGRYPLIGRQGALCGNIFFAKEKFHATEHAIVATPFKGIDITWLYYLLVHLNLNQYATGQAQPGLSVDILKKVTAIIPAKEKEQQKIADCLSSLDELIAAQAHKLDTLKAHKKGLMQQLFPAPGQTTPTLRFPEFQDAGEWQEKSLGELAKIITGNTPKTADPNNYGGERLFVSPADISDHRYISSTKTNLSDQGFENAREIPPKSILFVCIGSTIGKVAQNICECATNQQINSVIPFKEYSNDFIYSLLEKNSGEIAALAGKQAVPIINKTLFSSVTLSCPSLPEQQKIADCLTSLDELIAAHSRKLDTLKAHKKGLMQQLFPNPDEANG